MRDFLLTAENLPSYLVDQKLVRDEHEVAIRELGGGVSNIVLLVEWPEKPERRWVAKQSLGKLRVKDDWRSDRERIFREAGAIQALAPVLGDGATPQVISVDRNNYCFVMTAAPSGSVVWKEALLAGQVDADVAQKAGTLLARMIQASQADPAFMKEFSDRKVFDQLRIDPYYRTAAARHPDVQVAYRELIADSLKIQAALVHGDYSPKNMLVRDGKIFLIDFEVAHWGDPAFDSGFLLYLEAAREFWKALSAGLGPEGAADFEAMTVRHLGSLMLARIDGKSPVEYIRDEATKNRVRQAAKRILRELRPPRLEDAVGLASTTGS
jgi:5-methylthioribose kinase